MVDPDLEPGQVVEGCGCGMPDGGTEDDDEDEDEDDCSGRMQVAGYRMQDGGTTRTWANIRTERQLRPIIWN